MRGYTLIELMVVLCLISIISAMSTVSFRSFWRRYQLTIATQDLISQLQAQRIRAIINKKKATIKIEDQIIYTKKEKFYHPHTKLKQEVLYQKGRVNQPCIRQYLSGSIPITFNSTGASSAVTICLIYQEFSQKVILSSYGNIRRTIIQKSGVHTD